MKRTDFLRVLFFGTSAVAKRRHMFFGIMICLLQLCLVNTGFSQDVSASGTGIEKGMKLFIDVHRLEPGKVEAMEVAKAHQKDLAVQDQYHVRFMKYWVDTKNGMVYCLSAAHDSASIHKTHSHAHGLLPVAVYPVISGDEATDKAEGNYYLDIHQLGSVKAKDVADAHKKDLKVEAKHHVHFINYWVNEKNGVVFCLSKAKTAEAVIATHKEAHGLVPAQIAEVIQGQ